jgi:hypothetical protein
MSTHVEIKMMKLCSLSIRKFAKPSLSRKRQRAILGLYSGKLPETDIVLLFSSLLDSSHNGLVTVLSGKRTLDQYTLLQYEMLTLPISYYIHIILNQIGITSSTTQLLINGILQIVNMIVATGMCFFVDRLGRRLLFLVSTSGMLAVFIVWTICSAEFQLHGSKASANAVVVMIFLYYVFYNMAWSGLLVGYGVEILPYNIRAKVRDPSLQSLKDTH